MKMVRERDEDGERGKEEWGERERERERVREKKSPRRIWRMLEIVLNHVFTFFHVKEKSKSSESLDASKNDVTPA